MIAKTSIIKVALLVVFIALAIMLASRFDVKSHLEKEQLDEFIEKNGIWSYVIFGLICAIATVLFIPGTPLTIAAGYLFGSVGGILLVVISATIGSCLAFQISRFFGKSFIDALIKNKFRKLETYQKKLSENGFSTVLFLRLIPLFPFNGLNYALGLTRVPFQKYAFATALGIIPGSSILVIIGSLAVDIRNPLFYFFIMLFIALAFVPTIYKKYVAKSHTAMKDDDNTPRKK